MAGGEANFLETARLQPSDKLRSTSGIHYGRLALTGRDANKKAPLSYVSVGFSKRFRFQRTYGTIRVVLHLGTHKEPEQAGGILLIDQFALGEMAHEPDTTCLPVVL
jgi:hypothetical protein